MPKLIDVRDIFNPFGQPTATYVKRDNGKYEQSLSSALDVEGKLCLLTGPSKTGKTTLYNKVLSDKHLQPLIIRCDASVTASEFWRRSLEKIDFGRLSSSQMSKSEKVSGSGKIGGKIGWAWLAGILGEVSVGIESSMSEVEIREKILSQPSPDHLIPILKNLPVVLVVEDFHYLDTEVKKNIFQQWKVFTDNEVSVIVVGTTHHAVDLAYANKDLVGRISHIDLSTWDISDLEKISRQGFNFLGMTVGQSVTIEIARESVGLPIITQDVCYQLLSDKGITQVEQGKTSVQLNPESVYKALYNVAKTNYGQLEAMYERLIAGPRKQARKYNTYEFVLSTFGQDPLMFSLKRHQIDERLKNMPIPDGERPPIASVDSMLNALTKFQRDNEIELLEWNKNEQRLHILEPSFLFYLRWREERGFPLSLKGFLDSFLNDLKRPIEIGTAEFEQLDRPNRFLR
jgi:AAA domain